MLKSMLATLYQGFMLRVWSLSLSVAVWVLGRANKAKFPLPPVLDHLLLSEEEIEQRIGDFLQLIEIAAAGDDVSMLGSGEFPFQREIHDDDEVTTEGDVEDFVPTVLTFYVSSEMPDTLALVRYSTRDEESGIMLVNEDVYRETPDELVRLESDVHDCLMEGIDVSVLSHHDLNTFPYIESIIADT